jgi:hypothetical protein
VIWLIPFVDRGLKIDLDQVVPEWRSMLDEAIVLRLIEHVRQPAQPPD